ncbi:MAG TPA: response regulator, partial [Patescibacteria group bacterium]|nr:response regulator [Patescibacteria group bacterium]
SITRRYGGSGLGLTICRHLVELMDGHIAVSSAPGEGSIFAFTARLGIGVERRNLAARHHLHGLKTLVVDDQETSRQILQEMIESWSGQVVTLPDGEGVIEEIERAEAAGEPFELTLLDWQMPGRNGVDVARHIQEEAATGRMKQPPMVIMVTAYGKDRLLEESGTLHLDGFLTKPVTPSSLFNAVMGVREPSLAQPVDVRRMDVTPYDLALPIHGSRVLLVEDNAINQEVAQEFLEKAGLRVTIANNGREGVDLVRRTDFDVVLMDLQMPEMDGFEASRLIRTLPGGDCLPIIAMTAAAMPRDKQACAEAGMNDHVSKPIVPRELLTTLVRWVKPTEGAEAPTPSLSSSDEPFPDIPGINSRQAFVRLAGNRTLFLSLLGQMAERHGRTVSDVQAEIAANRPNEAARLLHTLRGVAGNVSANDVASLASGAENAIRDGASDRVGDILGRLDDAMGALVSAVRIHLAGLEPAAGEAAPLATGPVDKDALGTLVAALRARDAEALDHFESLHLSIAASRGREFTARLRSAIDGLRFEEAADLLTKSGGLP